MDVSIIIVNYNTENLIINCLRSVYEQTDGIDYEILVVDNCSKDNSVNAIKKNFPNVVVVESNTNLGFGRANNLGVESAKGRYLFFLNPDCILIENAIKKMFDFFESTNNEKNRIGAIGCILLDIDHKLNTSYQRFPTPGIQIRRRFIGIINKIFKTEIISKPLPNYDLDKNHEVDFITGADLFLPKEIFISLGGFDSSFFMYYEETDLQKKMSKVSLKRIILKDVNIIHLEGGATTKRLSSLTIFTDSDFKYMRKHFSPIVYFLYYLIMNLLLYPTLLSSSHSKNDKRDFKKMIKRNCVFIS
jgi:GT2 family glycosyltransferase